MSEKQDTVLYIEDLESNSPTDSSQPDISEEHKQYLLQRHGRVDLLPLPSMDPADPLNWPLWKKIANLAVVSFQSMVAIYTASCPIPAFELMSEYLQTDIVKISYLASIPIIFAGLPILFWKPVANRYGRRPIWIWASIIAGLFNIGAALSNSYGVLVLMRILPPTFSCAAVALGGATVSDTFFKHQRGKAVGVWALATTLGPPLGPLVTGIAVQHTGNWRTCFWILAGLNFGGAVLAALFAPESLYIRNYSNTGDLTKSEVFKNEYVTPIRRINPKPFTLREFYYPIIMWKYPTVIIPAIAHTVAFSFTIPAISISIPTSYGPKFGLNAQQVGLQFIAYVIGTLLGEVIAGPFSDLLMNRKQRRSPTFRLWGAYLGFAACIAGVLVWGITLQNAKVGPWIVTPDIGVAIGAFGNQILTTILMTFAIDCFPNQADAVSSAIVQVRQIWSFLVPFFTPVMFESLQFTKSAGLIVGLIGITGVVPVTLLHIKGTKRPILDETDDSH